MVGIKVRLSTLRPALQYGAGASRHCNRARKSVQTPNECDTVKFHVEMTWSPLENLEASSMKPAALLGVLSKFAASNANIQKSPVFIYNSNKQGEMKLLKMLFMEFLLWHSGLRT